MKFWKREFGERLTGRLPHSFMGAADQLDELAPSCRGCAGREVGCVAAACTSGVYVVECGEHEVVRALAGDRLDRLAGRDPCRVGALGQQRGCEVQLGFFGGAAQSAISRIAAACRSAGSRLQTDVGRTPSTRAT